jgi:fibronectin type 3 domain-containing protein
MKRPAVAAALLFLTVFAGAAYAAPGGFTITIQRQHCNNSVPSVSFDWTVSSGATSYSIVRNGVTIVSSTTALTFEDTNVTSGTSYTYSVIASDGTGTTPSSNSVTILAPFCIPPDNPSLAATVICQSGNPAVRLEWTAAARTERYEIYRNGVRYRANLPATTTQFIDASVTAGTQYSYFVRAENLATGAPSGPESDSNTVTLTVTDPCPPPPPPPAVSASAFCGTSAGLPAPKVTVTWTASAGAVAYQLHRNNSFIDQITTTSYEDANVVAGNTYTYVVYAVNSSGQSAPGSTTITIPEQICTPPPSAPAVQGGSICNPSNNSVVQLTWSGGANATTFTVLRNGAAIASNITANQYQDSPAIGGSYTYVVRAVNARGTADSAPLTITHREMCPRPPGAFTSSLSVICSNNVPAVRVTWTPSSGASLYTVLRNGAIIATGLSGSSYDDRSVAAGTTYSYAVRAVNDHGSTDSNTSNVTVADPCPRPPGNVTLTGRSFCSGTTAAVSLSWNDAPGATSYTVLRNGSAIASGLGGTSYTDNDVTAGTGYSYVVRAVNASGGTDSNPFSVTPASCNTTTPRADLAVSNVSLSRQSANAGETIEVSYTVANNGPAAAGETLTRIRIGTSPQPASAETIVFATATQPLASGASRRETHSFTVPARLQGRTYHVFVSLNDDRAVDETTFTNNAAGEPLTVVQPQCELSCLVTVPATALAGQPVTFTLLEQPACEVAVTWQFGDGASASGESATMSYSAPGTYNWTLIVTAAGGSSCANAGTIEVARPPATNRKRAVRH